MKKIILALIFLSFGQAIFAQKPEKLRTIAFRQIQTLHHNGALILRLHLHPKNVALYRKAGQAEIAEKIEAKNNNRNKILVSALLDESFAFCPVYVIDAKDYKKIQAGEKKGFFLNQQLAIDSTIKLQHDTFFVLDVGAVYDNIIEMKNGKRIISQENKAITHRALVIKDKNLNQLVQPFPFYTKLNNLNLDIRNLVIKPEMREKINAKKLYPTIDKYKSHLTKKYKLDETEMGIDNLFLFRNKLLLFYLKSIAK